MDASRPLEPPASVKSARSLPWRHTLRFLAATYALALVWGIRTLYYWEHSLLDLLVPVLFVIALGWWAVADAEARRHPIPLLARPWFYLCGWLLVPAYVIWSRGWRGLGWMVLHCIGWQALVIATWLILNIFFGDFAYRPRH